MALAIDSSTPAFVASKSTGQTTASFTPPVGSLLVAACTGTSFSGNPAFNVTSSGLTFVQQVLSNVAGQSTVTLFTAEVGAAGGSSRTVSCTSSGYASSGLKVWVITGQHASLYVDTAVTGTTGASPYSAPITTDTDGNWVLGAVADFADTSSITSSDTFETINNVDMSYMVVRKSAATSPAGSETLNIAAAGTGSAWAAISIRPDTFVAPAVYKVADRGSLSNVTTSTSSAVDMATAGSITTGNVLIARVALDNSGTNGVAPSCTVTDPRSNTWTVVGPGLADPGAANAGSTCYIAYCPVVNAYTNSDDVTFNHSPTTPAKAIVIEEWTGLDSTTPVAVAATTGSGATTAVSIARTPTATGQLMYAAVSVEGPTGDGFTQDSDTTDGNWQTLTRLSTATGTAASNQTINGAAKLVTGTSAQTYDPTLGTTRDWAAVALVFAAASGGFTGTVAVTQASDTSSASGVLGYSGTVSRTQADNTSSASGSVANPVTGVVAATQSANTSSATGVLGYTGTLARTQANQTSAASGVLGYSGTMAATQAAQTSAATGTLGYTGTVAATQGNQTSAASGTVTAAGFAGSVAVTQASQTSTASGLLGYVGTVAGTQANQVSSASGTNTPAGFSGSVAATQANQTSSASGVLGYSGTVARTQDANTSSASGLVGSGFLGSVAAVQASQTSTGSGVLGYTGVVNVTQAANTSSASGKLGYLGTLARTQGNQISAAAGVVANPVTGTVAVPQAANTSHAVGVIAGLQFNGRSNSAVNGKPSNSTVTGESSTASATTRRTSTATVTD